MKEYYVGKLEIAVLAWENHSIFKESRSSSPTKKLLQAE